MNVEKEKYITAGELASLYSIPKQTLLYYDKMGLLVPLFVNSKGYRFYSVSQYLTLEIIVNLRKLNISIQAIKAYLKNRNIDHFEEILRNKEAECTQIIAEMQELRQSVQHSLKSLDTIRKMPLNQIELRFCQERKLFISESIPAEKRVKERMKILSRHNQAAFSPKHFKEFTTGWIIAKEDFSHKIFNKTLQYFTPTAASLPEKKYTTCPAGLYLNLCFDGTYYEKAPVVWEKITAFIERNHLKILSNVYIFPLQNHWITEDTTAYINQISMMVEYEE
ncbi:MAG: MerR family transcriptional regulator [Sporomusaceae bacterium]|nr:MerR family transcriptional regulator [Sporomusaceae bacterium]